MKIYKAEIEVRDFYTGLRTGWVERGYFTNRAKAEEIIKKEQALWLEKVPQDPIREIKVTEITVDTED